MMITTVLGVPATLPAIAAVAAEQAPDPHPTWHAEWRVLVEWCDTADTGGRELAECPEYHRALVLEGLIHGTLARTPAGVLAQLRLLDYWHGQETTMNETDSAGLANAIASLKRLAGEATRV